MSVKEIIKAIAYNSLIRGDSLNITQICIIFMVACVVGIYIFMVYKNFSKDAFYSRDLNITISGMCVAVSAMMIAMQSNLVVSLGMVGALSIVRFRTAVKNPIDLLYLFWSISSGVICGVGLYTLAIVLCAIMTFMIWLLGIIPIAKAPAVLVVRGTRTLNIMSIDETIKKNCRSYHLTSDQIRNEERELIYEVQTIDKKVLTTELTGFEGITSVACLEHDGEVRA